MKNKKYIWIGFFVLSILLLTYSYKDIKLYYYVKMGNKNYYSKNYEKAIEYYEKALKIKEDYNIRINLIITDYQMKNYKKVLESPVENGFLKGNSLVFMSEENQNNQDSMEDLKKSLEYYKEEILTNDDVNIKKNYEIIENRLKEQQQNKDNQNNDNNQQENKDKKQNQNSDSEKDKNNNNNQQNNQSQNNDKQNQEQTNKENSNNSQSNQNNNDNQNNLDKNNNEQNNSQENLDNSDKEKSKNNDQEKNQNSNSENKKERENNKNSNSQNSSLDKSQQTKQQKELQLMLKNLEKSEKQSFKNNERLIGVENESDTKNKW